jgi:hypothetical protein
MTGSKATASLEETLLILLACATLSEKRRVANIFIGSTFPCRGHYLQRTNVFTDTPIVGTRLHVTVSKLIYF